MSAGGRLVRSSPWVKASSVPPNRASGFRGMDSVSSCCASTTYDLQSRSRMVSSPPSGCLRRLPKALGCFQMRQRLWFGNMITEPTQVSGVSKRWACMRKSEDEHYHNWGYVCLLLNGSGRKRRIESQLPVDALLGGGASVTWPFGSITIDVFSCPNRWIPHPYCPTNAIEDSI